MNKKDIQKYIEKTLEYWLDSLPTTKLKEAARRDVIVSGGCIASMLIGEPVRDYDLYFKTANTAYELAKHYTKSLGRDAVKLVEDRVVLNAKAIKEGRSISLASHLYSPLYYSHNAISLTGGLQLITRFCGSVEYIHSTFDFEHTKNYYTYDTGLVLSKSGLESLLARELNYVGSGFPVCALFRVHKFIKRGWKITPVELMKIVYDIAQLDVSDPKVIKEQLGGYYGQNIAKQLNIKGKLNRDTFFAIVEGYGPKLESSIGNYE